MNRYGIDDNYFKKELKLLIKSLPNKTPEELNRHLQCLANIVYAPTFVQHSLSGSEKALHPNPLKRTSDKLKRYV